MRKLIPNMQTKSRIYGFSVVEVLIVVVIITIAAMVAIPMMSSAGSMQVRSAANMIAADLEYAKSMAITMGQNFSVVFDDAAESYQIEDQNGDVIEHPVQKGSNYVMDLRNDSRLDEVDIVDAAFNSTSGVRFDCLGIPYDDDGGELNSGVVTLQAGGLSIAVTVEPVTGFISIAEL